MDKFQPLDPRTPLGTSALLQAHFASSGFHIYFMWLFSDLGLKMTINCTLSFHISHTDKNGSFHLTKMPTLYIKASGKGRVKETVNVWLNNWVTKSEYMR